MDLWRDYRAYKQLEVENAKQWVELWQQQVEYFQEIEIDSLRRAKHTDSDDGLRRLEKAAPFECVLMLKTGNRMQRMHENRSDVQKRGWYG